MSYSFVIKAASAALALAAVEAKFDEIVASQPIHANDKAQVLANAKSAIDFIAVDETRDVSVSVNGYLSWSGNTEEEGHKFTSASFSASASLCPRETPLG